MPRNNEDKLLSDVWQKVGVVIAETLSKLAEKCKNCPNFSPTVDKIDYTTIGGEKNISQTVYCSERSLCKNIEEYLKNK